ncbi:MAG TPA: dienelactone hydrolase family protein [Gemmatimonadaceae bacterium]|nr:dienelactone hydrolase family protein [Gemmatimonadaceae bacterium]
MAAVLSGHDVTVTSGGVALRGLLGIPSDARGVVLFAHGSGSGRLSSRNNFVARSLQDAGLATLLIDLLTEDEERADARTGHLRFDIEFLATRLEAATEWLTQSPDTASLKIGYFGASTGAAAALVAAAEMPDRVHAVVSRGGRPDLAGDSLAKVEAPTLLIVGSRDVPVIPLNEDAFAQLRCEKKLEIVPGASHLFEEAGTLEVVARLAASWFDKYLRGAD